MKKLKKIRKGKSKELPTSQDMTYWLEDINGIAFGHIEFEDVPKSGDLISLEYGEFSKFFVIYSEEQEISNELLIGEEVSEDEYFKYISEWRGVGTHVAIGDPNYLNSSKHLC